VRPPLRRKPAQLRAYRRIKRSGGFDVAGYLARNPDVAASGFDPLMHYVEFGARERRNPGGAGPGLRPAEAMKRDWDDRARADAMHFVASERLDWDERSFSESGRRAVEELIEDDLERICAGRDPSRMRILEIGCGVGRMTEHLARIFGEVHGVDVSGEMISGARGRLGGLDTIFLSETDGTGLAGFEDGFFDFAFSFIVFQHVPDKGVVVSNLREVHRTLRPGGTFKFQVQGAPGPASDDRLADTWVGVSFDADELRSLASEIGFEVIATEGAGTQYLWSWWRRI
jgi:SAM-dependent methyltransferase